MAFQPHYGDLDQWKRHIERELTRLGSAGTNANQQLQGSGGRGAVVTAGSAGFSGQIPEAQVVFEDTSGHDHSAGNATAVPMAGEVTGSNQAAVVSLAGDVSGTALVNVVDKVHGKTLPAAPSGADAGKALRYDGSAGYNLEGQRQRIRTVTTTATFGADDDVILGDTTGGAFSVNLPAAAASNRRVYTLKRVNAGANNLTLQANGAETIDGANTTVLAAQWKSATVVCDSTAWYLIAAV